MSDQDEKYLLPSQRLVGEMSAVFKRAYGGLEAQMLGVGPETRVARLRESMGLPGAEMMGLSKTMERER